MLIISLSVLLSVLASVATAAVITIKITAAVQRELMVYVEEICDINVEQAQKIKESALKTVDMLVDSINQNKPV